MRILFQKVTIADSQSKHHGKTTDLLIEDGKIVEIKKNIEATDALIISEKGLHLSPGWVDVGVQVCDPGFEHREDLHTVAAAAAAGGFTNVLVQPNTLPVLQSKAQVTYLENVTFNEIVRFHAVGALSENTEGKNITEMSDLHFAGVKAFSDGKKSIQSSGLMLRALQYVKAFEGIVINHPHDKEIARNGQVHEGFISTSLGLPGLPSMAEELMVQRDIALLEYTGSRLHISNISTAGSVALVKAAKKKGLNISASVAALNLAFEAEQLQTFNPMFKVLPPLREKEDRKALVKGLKEGVIDFISSNHTPWEEEAKKLEFSYAEFGALGLQTSYSLSVMHGKLSTEDLVTKLSHRPREIFGLPEATIAKGSFADLTAFLPAEEYTFSADKILSKSKNSPMLGQELTGRVLGIVNKGQTTF